MSSGLSILCLFVGAWNSGVAAPQKKGGGRRPPETPGVVWAVRVGPGVIGVDWSQRLRGEARGFIVYRATRKEGPYKAIARRGGDQPYFLDAAIQPKQVYFYKVAAFNDPENPSAQAGPACAWDDDQLIPNPSFELDRPGPMQNSQHPIWWPSRAYNVRTPIVIRPGGPDGKQCVEIQSSNACVSGGLRSLLVPMIEGEEWYQEAWARALQGARPLVGRCFYAADRRTIRGKNIRKPYDYTSAGPVRKDGWRKYSGTFVAGPTTCFVQVWLIGFKARNTFWLDGAKLVDLTAVRMKSFQLEPFLEELEKLQKSAVGSSEKLSNAARLKEKILALRKRLKEAISQLTPLQYRRLLVELSRTQQQLVEEIWALKILAILESED